MIRLAFESLSPWITFRPTPPTPKTAAVSPGATFARFSTEPTPVRTPQPMRHADAKGTSSGIFTVCASVTTVCSTKTEVAAKFEAGSPSSSKGVEMLPRLRMHQVGCPSVQALQLPQLASVVMTTWSPAWTLSTPGPTDSTMPAPSCPRTEGGFQGIVPSMTERSE